MVVMKIQDLKCEIAFYIFNINPDSQSGVIQPQ